METNTISLKRKNNYLYYLDYVLRYDQNTKLIFRKILNLKLIIQKNRLLLEFHIYIFQIVNLINLQINHYKIS